MASNAVLYRTYDLLSMAMAALFCEPPALGAHCPQSALWRRMLYCTVLTNYSPWRRQPCSVSLLLSELTVHRAPCGVEYCTVPYLRITLHGEGSPVLGASCSRSPVSIERHVASNTGLHRTSKVLSTHGEQSDLGAACSGSELFWERPVLGEPCSGRRVFVPASVFQCA